MPKKVRDAILYGTDGDEVRFSYDDGARAYKVVKPSWYVFSGVKANNILYEKAFVSGGQRRLRVAQVLAESDAVSLHVRLTPDTRHLIAHWDDRSAIIAAPFEISRLRQRTNDDFRALLTSRGIDTILLLSPTTTDERLATRALWREHMDDILRPGVNEWAASTASTSLAFRG